MNYDALRRRVPRSIDRYLWHFENSIEDAVRGFASGLPEGAYVLDAGSGEGRYRRHFDRARYVGVDLGVGDTGWNYRGLDAVCDISSLPFRPGRFDACLNIVTLEHVQRPREVIAELGRVLKPGGRMLLVAPQDWQVHQAPHDYFRYTRYGLRHLMECAGFHDIRVEAGGGFFRLLGRRMLNGIQYFRGPWVVPGALLLLPGGLLFPLLDGLDREKDFTLGYICTAVKG